MTFIEEWDPSPNFSSREGRKIIAIVNHITAGSFEGALSWLKNPAAQASAHFIISKMGRIVQLVREGDKAWHAGSVNKPSWSLYDGTNPNLYTLGIEHEGQPGDALTEDQYQATLFLHKELTQKYGIPIDIDHIIGHHRIDSVNKVNCPGSGFPWGRLFRDLSPSIPAPVDKDGYLMVRVLDSKADGVLKQIVTMGYACKRITLP